MTQDREELKRLAEAAYHDYGLADIAVGGGMRATVSVPAFITAASPSTVLSLLSDLEAMQEALKVCDQALLEVQCAQQRGASWYTRGERGLYEQVAMHVRRGQEAIASARQALSKEPEA